MRPGGRLATRKAGEAFLCKPVDPRELVASICSHGHNARQMIETASRDTLTGLLKGSFVNELLDAELDRACRLDQPTCVAMIDLDHFKSVNDCHECPPGELSRIEVVGLADSALYAAKAAGRNRIVLSEGRQVPRGS